MSPRLPDFTLTALVSLTVTVTQIDTVQAGDVAAAPIVAPSSAVAPGATDASDRFEQGKALIDRAIFNLESRHSISADIRHETNLFGEQIVGNGNYYEQRSGPRPRVRLELKFPFGDKVGPADIPVADQTGTLVRVCDGDYLWTYRRLLGGGQLSRVDLNRVAQAIENADKPPQQGGLDGLAGAGGLSRLLRGLDTFFRFEVLRETKLLETPVLELRGQWRPEQLAKLLPAQKQAIKQGRGVDLGALPPQLPEYVVLYLGKQDLFPYRFEYRRSKTKGEANAEESYAIVTMQLLEVNVNVPIDPSHFDYRPGDIEPVDETEQYLKTLGL